MPIRNCQPDMTTGRAPGHPASQPPVARQNVAPHHSASQHAASHPAAPHPAAPGHALEQVFLDNFDEAPGDKTMAASRTIHVFQCGMVSEAALKDLLSESDRRKDGR